MHDETLFTISPEDDKSRLDKFLLKKFPHISRSFLQALCKEDQVYVNNTPQKSGYKLRWGDAVYVHHDMTSIGEVPAIEIPIVYEDDNILVVNKPSGVLSHGLSKFKHEPSVASFLRQHTPNGVADDIRFGIVHRLDRLTSGIMVCAKNSTSMQLLQKQFANQTVKKEYTAISSGVPKHKKAVIDVPIERDPTRPATFRPGKNGKNAVTQYRIIEQIAGRYSVLLLTPKTGRTHQLRVHLKYINAPIVGDVVYGTVTASRMMLHASSISLALPHGETCVFEATLPSEFNAYINKVKHETS